MSPQGRGVSPRVATLARWALALVVVGLLASFVDLGAIGARLAGADLRLAVPAVIGLVLVHVLAATTWRRLLRTLAGVSLGWATALRLYYAAQVLGTITPGAEDTAEYGFAIPFSSLNRVRVSVDLGDGTHEPVTFTGAVEREQ